MLWMAQQPMFNHLSNIGEYYNPTGLSLKRNINYMIGNIDILVKELCKLPKEVGWVEFKHNNCEPNMIGEDISALANTATLNDRDYAYMIWGVDDTTHEIIGTKVRLQMEKKGEQELENKFKGCSIN